MPFDGEKIIYEASCASTNSLALDLLSVQDLLEETIIITDNQFQGRGQRDNVWISEPYKNLTFSLVMYPTWLLISNAFLLNIITTTGILQALKVFVPHGLCIKWPNDIYYQEKKIGGILIENLVTKNNIRASVIGIGININQLNFNIFTASSLALICGYEFNLSDLLMQITSSIKRQYIYLLQEGKQTCQEIYLNHLYWLKEKRIFEDKEGTFKGIIQGIDEIGRLKIAKENQQIQHYIAKEIKYIC